MAVINVGAEGVNTVKWMSEAYTGIAVPVYQRQYRWEIEGCQRLLEDIRTVAAEDDQQTHFIGSILATTDSSQGGEVHLTLIDGQQRVATLTLLVAALHHTLEPKDQAVAAELQGLLVQPTPQERTKLLPHEDRATELDNIVFRRASNQTELGVSAFEDNYQFFLREVQGDAERVWRGLQRLEHVYISLNEGSNPQQVFESLNSTGTPLKNNELIHNYILMGLSHTKQVEIENNYWSQIEKNVGSSIDDFLRDYLIQKTGRDSEFQGELGIYNVFKKEFPRFTVKALRRLASEWTELSAVYAVLLEPHRAKDSEIETQLQFINTFGTAMYPLLMAIYRDYQRGTVTRAQLLETLERLQSLFLRRMVVGTSRDHLAAQLCRKRSKQPGKSSIIDIVRRTPSDERVRTALKHRSVPHAGYVLQRLQEVDSLEGMEIEHIFPQTAVGTWTGDGARMWSALSEGERARHRELLNTLGNLTLLEQPLNGGAGNKPFKDKAPYYERSNVAATRSLAEAATWDVQKIEARTESLTDAFLRTWHRPDAIASDVSEELVPILDVPKRPGWYQGWKTDFEYVQFCGEIWEVRNVKTLFNRTFKHLWNTRREDVIAYSSQNESPVFTTREWNGQWDPLGDTHYLFMGLFPQYLLSGVQAILEDFELEDKMFVKYSTDDSHDILDITPYEGS